MSDTIISAMFNLLWLCSKHSTDHSINQQISSFAIVICFVRNVGYQ